jgi:phosphoenolpyruvate phosphomutase
MNAIILNSGIGKRLKPLTNDKPKSLIKINEVTILEYQLNLLSDCKIKNVLITTGPFENKVKKFLKDKYSNLKITYVNNPKYDKTNYIYSIWLTKDLIDDDIILIHGDLIFSIDLLKKVINSKDNVVLVNKTAKPPKKDFKAVIESDKVIKIGVNFFGKNTFFSLPLYKFSKNDFLNWINEIEKMINAGKLNIYAEDAFNKISDLIILKPLYFSKELCMEIDTIEDLEIARNSIR